VIPRASLLSRVDLIGERLERHVDRISQGLPLRPILVTGATGRVGSETITHLLGAGRPVRALTRRPDTAALPPEVEVFGGDLEVPESLDAALDGVDSVFLVWTGAPTTVSDVIQRLASRGSRVVFLSAPHQTPHPFFQQPNPARVMAERMEQLIEASGVEWTYVRSGMFAGNARHFWGPQIRTADVVRWPYLDASTAPTDERDVAAVAVRTLCEPGHAGKEYVVTGPQSLTQAEQILTIGRAIGRSLRVEEISANDAQSELLPAFGSPVVVQMLLDAWAAAVGQKAFVTSTSADLTGTPARTFLQWATDHAQEFRA